jgi:hypothetical protein
LWLLLFLPVIVHAWKSTEAVIILKPYHMKLAFSSPVTDEQVVLPPLELKHAGLYEVWQKKFWRVN